MDQRRGITTLEYAVLIAVVCAALLAAGRFFMAGVSGQWRAAGDTFGGGRQFDPAATAR